MECLGWFLFLATVAVCLGFLVFLFGIGIGAIYEERRWRTGERKFRPGEPHR